MCDRVHRVNQRLELAGSLLSILFGRLSKRLNNELRTTAMEPVWLAEREPNRIVSRIVARIDVVGRKCTISNTSNISNAATRGADTVVSRLASSSAGWLAVEA